MVFFLFAESQRDCDDGRVLDVYRQMDWAGMHYHSRYSDEDTFDVQPIEVNAKNISRNLHVISIPKPAWLSQTKPRSPSPQGSSLCRPARVLVPYVACSLSICTLTSICAGRSLLSKGIEESLADWCRERGVRLRRIALYWCCVRRERELS